MGHDIIIKSQCFDIMWDCYLDQTSSVFCYNRGVFGKKSAFRGLFIRMIVRTLKVPGCSSRDSNLMADRLSGAKGRMAMSELWDRPYGAIYRWTTSLQSAHCICSGSTENSAGMDPLCTSQLNPREGGGGGGGAGNGRAMPGLSCLVHQNAAPQGGDITN